MYNLYVARFRSGPPNFSKLGEKMSSKNPDNGFKEFISWLIPALDQTEKKPDVVSSAFDPSIRLEYYHEREYVSVEFRDSDIISSARVEFDYHKELQPAWSGQKPSRYKFPKVKLDGNYIKFTHDQFEAICDAVMAYVEFDEFKTKEDIEVEQKNAILQFVNK